MAALNVAFPGASRKEDIIAPAGREHFTFLGFLS
jgi:hypothetical protein